MSYRAVLTLVIASIALSGCGGGGSGGSSVSSSSGTGQVAVLVRDAAVDEYTNIFMTVHEISIRPSDDADPIMLFSSGAGESIDLLSLQDQDYVLSIADGIPAGSYDRIDLVVSSVETVGGPCDVLDVVVPSGRVKLKPREAFTVVPGGTLSLRLDVDVNKSLRLHPAGASGQCIFRPVVHVEAVSGVPDDRCHRNLVGIAGEETFDGADLVGFELDLGDDRGPIAIDIDPATIVFFGADGNPLDSTIVELGATLTVHGRLGADGEFDAAAIIAGEALEIDGVVGATDTSGFDLDPTAGGAIVGPIPVATFDETALFLGCDATEADVVQEGSDATVTGKLSVGDSELRAAVVVIDLPSVQGAVIEIEEVVDGYDLTIQPNDPTAAVVTVFVPDSVPFEVAGAGPVDPLRIVDLVGCADRAVEVALDPTDLEVALAVSFTGDELEGVVEAIDTAAGEWTLDGQLIAVDGVVQVIDLRGVQANVDLDAVEVGDSVRVFGFAACPTDAVVFYATVVTILPGEGDDDSEGCGHGYWKQSQHFDSWPDAYSPETLFDDVFEDAFPGMTLLAVLQQGGGGLNSLGRSLVAALLNAAAPGVDYEYSADQVIAMFDDIFPGGDYQGLKSQLNSSNEAGCPLN